MDRTLHSLIILHGRLYWPPDIKTPVDKHEVKSISTWVSLLTNETCSNLPGPTFVICYHKINPCSGPRLSQVTSPSFRKRLSLKGLSLSTANLVYLHWDPIVLNGSYIHWWQDLGLGNKHSEVFGGVPLRPSKSYGVGVSIPIDFADQTNLTSIKLINSNCRRDISTDVNDMFTLINSKNWLTHFKSCCDEGFSEL